MEFKGSVLRFDDMMKLSIPSVRYALSIILKEKYRVNQTDIAKLLGITQAAVNKYLNKKCSNEIIHLGSKIIKTKLATQTAYQITKAKKESSRRELVDKLASSKEILKLGSENISV